MRVLALVGSIALGSCVGDHPAPTPQPPRPSVGHGGSLVVDITGVRNRKGRVRVGLFDQERFPISGEQLQGVRVPAKTGTVVATFHQVPAGTYAIAVFHDENDNGEIDTGAFGQPIEGIGFSRNGSATFGPPDFEDAAIDVAESGETRIRIELRY